jgi:hypothetical protein
MHMNLVNAIPSLPNVMNLAFANKSNANKTTTFLQNTNNHLIGTC